MVKKISLVLIMLLISFPAAFAAAEVKILDRRLEHVSGGNCKRCRSITCSNCTYSEADIHAMVSIKENIRFRRNIKGHLEITT